MEISIRFQARSHIRLKSGEIRFLMKIFLYFPSYFPHFYNIILGYHRILLYHSLFYFGTRFFVYISVNSTEGEGSEFIVSLRFAVDQESFWTSDFTPISIAFTIFFLYNYFMIFVCADTHLYLHFLILPIIFIWT